ncbi:helix-turn-helix domain-containing protein [Paraburkholderia sp. GAS348]|uniref:helix-turn-helix domain-containing protein n=1 Tax=Paraburkholderia sp. GAS348 TaxID=3035132 RepID=UPI003D25F5E7
MDELNKTALVRAVGQAIASRRATAGLSQEKVAEALGITREAVSRMETGVAVPTVLRLAELAEIFECAIEELVTGVSSRKIDQAQRIVELLDNLTDERRDMVMKMLRILSDGLAER